MIRIRHVQPEDRQFWFSLDGHLPQEEFHSKVRNRTGYVILADGVPVGLMRYNLFWDQVPFCNLLYIEKGHQRRGWGRMLMEHWEAEMKAKGYDRLMTSTQANEEAQHFYRKLGYRDCGGFVLEVPEPMELMFVKEI